ncbi:cytochrome c biogenesis protein CcdA [bacterium]|nr:cytochrome c biogenesis protein CcdA [bacterium]
MLDQISQRLVEYMSGNDFSVMFLVVSFLGGILASISPCSLGVLPLIIGYVGGYGDKDKFKTFLQLCSFVLGLALVLSVIGIICVIGGGVFSSFGGAYWILFLASLILVMGLNLLDIIQLNLSPIVKKIPQGNKTSLFIYPLIVGMLFAFASSPCSTPILAGIMSFATLTKSIVLASLMLFLFSIGQGLIIVLAGVFTSFLKGLRNFAHISEFLMKFSGVILILSAIAIYIKVFSRFI